MIIESLLASAEAKATMYLSAAITSTTPELRSAYAASLTQAIEAHTALKELAINKGWKNPYESPSEQLNCAVNDSLDAVRD